MTLQTTISAPNLAKIRANKYHAQQFVVSVPNVTVVQFQPSANPATSVYGDIAVGSVGAGSMSNIKTMQTVIYSTTTDYIASETYRTYVRKVSGTSTLFVGRNGQSLTTAMYVTVINTYDYFEKPGVMRNDVRFVDWDVSFRRLLPVESDLPTAVVLADDETSWTPTANPKAVDNDATSTFTHAWESSNSNDVLNSGGTTASPDWTFEADSHRWIRYTFTDSNGNANLRVITIWTVPKSLASVVNLGFIGQSNDVANIGYQQGLGWSCTVPAISGITTLAKGTLVCVWSMESYNNVRGSIQTNINFVGYLGVETTVTGGSETFGRISETRFIVNGFGAKLSTLSVPIVNVINTSSPNEWDEMENATPLRAISYLLSEYTTALHLCALRFPANHTDYIADGDLLVCEMDTASEAFQYQGQALSAIVQFSRDGILDLTQNLVESDDTARNAADVVVHMTPTDWIEYSIERDPDPVIRLLTVYAGTYNTSSNTYDVYRAIVPPIADIRGYGEEERVNIVLSTNLSDANARIETAQRAANLYAALNPAPVIDMTMNDEWHFLQPDVGTWYTFGVAIVDTVRGIVYDSNTRWQLLEINYASNNQTGRKETQAKFRQETQNTGANIEVSRVETDVANEINALPGILPPFSGGDLGLTDGEWFDSFDTQPSSDDPPPSADCELLGFRPKDGLGTNSVQSALTGESIAYQVSGFGLLQSGEDQTDDFAAGSQGWVSYGVGGVYIPFAPSTTITSGNSGTHSGAWNHGDVTRSNDGTASRIVQISKDLGTPQRIHEVTVTYNLTKGSYFNPATNTAAALYVSLDGLNWTGLVADVANDVSSGTGLTLEYQNDIGVDARYIGVFIRSSQQATSGSCSVTEVEYSSYDRYGDALYQWHAEIAPTAYESGDGFLFEGAQPDSIPAYRDDHTYPLFDPSVDSGPLIFDFESPYNLSEMENWSLQIIACFLGVA